MTFELSDSVTDVQGNRPHVVDGKKIETKRATPKHVSKTATQPRCLLSGDKAIELANLYKLRCKLICCH